MKGADVEGVCDYYNQDADRFCQITASSSGDCPDSKTISGFMTTKNAMICQEADGASRKCVSIFSSSSYLLQERRFA